jgi:hypothetical protein
MTSSSKRAAKNKLQSSSKIMKSYWDSAPKRSLAYLRFRNSHTEINESYWGLILTRSMACKYSGAFTPETGFENSGLFEPSALKRYPKTFKLWSKNIAPTEKWIRLQTLLSASAYLEKFVHEITTTALLADPGVLIGMPKAISGLPLLRRGHQLYGIDIVGTFTGGEWDKRAAALKKIFPLFNGIPNPVMSDLDKIRTLRNKVAHRYGFEFNIFPPITIDEPRNGVRHEQLLAYLASIEKAAKLFESYFLKEHIGYFEYLRFWHQWDKKNIPPHKTLDFQKIAHGIGAHIKTESISKERAKNLIELYKA